MSEWLFESEGTASMDLGTMRGVQLALVTLGFDPGEADGFDGPKTQGAVREFQAQAGLDVDGVVGPNTRRALLEALTMSVQETVAVE